MSNLTREFGRLERQIEELAMAAGNGTMTSEEILNELWRLQANIGAIVDEYDRRCTPAPAGQSGGAFGGTIPGWREGGW